MLLNSCTTGLKVNHTCLQHLIMIHHLLIQLQYVQGQGREGQ